MLGICKARITSMRPHDGRLISWPVRPCVRRDEFPAVLIHAPHGVHHRHVIAVHDLSLKQALRYFPRVNGPRDCITWRAKEDRGRLDRENGPATFNGHHGQTAAWRYRRPSKTKSCTRFASRIADSSTATRARNLRPMVIDSGRFILLNRLSEQLYDAAGSYAKLVRRYFKAADAIWPCSA